MDELEQQVAKAATKAARWAKVPVVKQASENADTPVEARAKWAKVYRLFGASGEAAQDEAFVAVNMYFLQNGCSPSGRYRKPVRTAGGIEIESGEIVKITGKQYGEIRQFMRGRLEDSYMFLKHNPAIKDDEELAVKCENAGVDRSYAWLNADWLGRDCPYFVGDESQVYNRLRTSKIAAAYNKQSVALPTTDLVREYAPESKLSAVHHERNGGYNNDLF